MAGGVALLLVVGGVLVKRVQGSLFPEEERPAHHCHAKGCPKEVAPRFLMCPRHWYMVPAPLRARVWALYRPGQEIDKNPTTAYLDAMDAAIEAVAKAEGR